MLKWLSLAALVMLLVWWLIPYVESHESQVLRHHQRLLVALKEGDQPSLRSLLAESFEFDELSSREDAMALYEEKGTLFRAYQFEYGQPEFLPASSETQKVLSQHVQVLAKPNSPFPAPQAVPTQPWNFHWQQAKSGLAKWELVRVTNPEFRR